MLGELMDTSRNSGFLDAVQGGRNAATGTGLLGSDANFIAMQSIAPGGRAKGTMNLDSDPKNPASTAQRRNSPEK